MGPSRRDHLPDPGWLRHLRRDRAGPEQRRYRVTHPRSRAERLRGRAPVPVPGPGRATRIRGIPPGAVEVAVALRFLAKFSDGSVSFGQRLVTCSCGPADGKKSLSASPISARTGAPDMTTPTMVTDVWVCPRARARRTGTPAPSSARA